MIETALVSFTTFFVTIGPVDVAVLFASLTAHASISERRRIAFKGVFIASVILFTLAIGGTEVLAWLGITLPALRISGGLLLLLIAVDMVFARHSGAFWPTPDESAEARQKEDISAFPLATPLLAGPGAMGAAVLRDAESQGDLELKIVVLGTLAAVMLLSLALLLTAAQVQRLAGVTAVNVITRVMGVLLAALAAQLILDGIAASGLLPPHIAS
jgi:multiple antibiotic resistance protein